MKKLMIAFASVAIAAGVQAANVDWKIQSNSAEIGNEMYAVLASSLTGKDLAKLYAADITGNALKWTDKKDGYFDSATIVNKSGKGTTEYTVVSDAALPVTDASVYLVAVTADGKEYAFLNASPYDVTAKVYADGASSPGAFSASNTAALTYTKFQSQDVPEPTSALLMLLGVAGLALKRKVA